MMCSLWAGASRANTLVMLTASASSASLMASICGPSSHPLTGTPTSLQMSAVMISLSPVRILTSTSRP